MNKTYGASERSREKEEIELVKKQNLILIVLRTKQCLKVSQLRNLPSVQRSAIRQAVMTGFTLHVFVDLPFKFNKISLFVDSIKPVNKKLTVRARAKASF
jgi:hypothetical protein